MWPYSYGFSYSNWFDLPKNRDIHARGSPSIPGVQDSNGKRHYTRLNPAFVRKYVSPPILVLYYNLRANSQLSYYSISFESARSAVSQPLKPVTGLHENHTENVPAQQPIGDGHDDDL